MGAPLFVDQSARIILRQAFTLSTSGDSALADMVSSFVRVFSGRRTIRHRRCNAMSHYRCEDLELSYLGVWFS